MLETSASSTAHFSSAKSDTHQQPPASFIDTLKLWAKIIKQKLFGFFRILYAHLKAPFKYVFSKFSSSSPASKPASSPSTVAKNDVPSSNTKFFNFPSTPVPTPTAAVPVVKKTVVAAVVAPVAAVATEAGRRYAETKLKEIEAQRRQYAGVTKDLLAKAAAEPGRWPPLVPTAKPADIVVKVEDKKKSVSSLTDADLRGKR